MHSRKFKPQVTMPTTRVFNKLLRLRTFLFKDLENKYLHVYFLLILKGDFC
jgi:hypothetical protein